MLGEDRGSADVAQSLDLARSALVQWVKVVLDGWGNRAEGTPSRSVMEDLSQFRLASLHPDKRGAAEVRGLTQNAANRAFALAVGE